jgi:hypothetical protein
MLVTTPRRGIHGERSDAKPRDPGPREMRLNRAQRNARDPLPTKRKRRGDGTLIGAFGM